MNCVCSHKADDGEVSTELKRKFEGESEVKSAKGGTKRTYKAPENQAKINELSHKNFAYESKKKIKWAVNMYDEWRVNRMKSLMVDSEIRNCDLAFVKYFSKQELSHCLARFITEVKKIDNTDFTGKTLQEIIIMIQMHLHQNGVYWKLLDEAEFRDLRNILDNLMKDRHAKGLGVKQKCEIISLSHEDRMFDCNVFGESDPEQLLRTVIYMLGLHLALRGGVKHLRLRRPGFDPQIVTELDEGSGQEILVYREDQLQKTNQGGLQSKPNNKVVKVFPSSNMRRCPVRLYGKYIGLLPTSKSCGKLYLRPKLRYNPITWFNDQPYSKNKICGVVKTLCKLTNIEGKFSNHSLRATSASRMFDNNVPEQVIKEITGHKSECVRVYKQTSDSMLKSASKSIAGSDVKEGDESENESELISEVATGEQKQRLKESLSVSQMIKNVVKTRMEMRKKSRKSVIGKIAKKRVTFNKQRLTKKRANVGKLRRNKNNKLVIDLNVNVKYMK